jgi:hypothetical protein
MKVKGLTVYCPDGTQRYRDKSYANAFMDMVDECGVEFEDAVGFPYIINGVIKTTFVGVPFKYVEWLDK